MKGQWKGFIFGILASLLLSGLMGTAAATASQRSAQPDSTHISVTLDGEEVDLIDANGDPVEPFAMNGTTYLPVRAISSALGLNVGWDQATSTVILETPTERRAIYITRTGSKYHYDPTCNGGTYWEAPLSTALGMGLEPCNKCVHD